MTAPNTFTTGTHVAQIGDPPLNVTFTVHPNPDATAAGICFPFALVLLERRRCKHTYVDGQRLVFSGTRIGLFGLWIKWFLLIVITAGIYSFWVAPRIQQWKVENTDFDSTWQPNTLGGVPSRAMIQTPPRRPAMTV